MAHAAHKAYVITQQMGHEIPISLGVIGFMPGFFWGLHVVRGRYDMTSKFTQKILDWTKLHPDDPSGAFILENSRDGRRNRKDRRLGSKSI